MKVSKLSKLSKLSKVTARVLMAAGAVGFLAIAVGILSAQAPGGSGRGGGGGFGNNSTDGPAIFSAADKNKDGFVTRNEMKSAFDAWYAKWDTDHSGALTEAQILAGLDVAFPICGSAAAGGGFNAEGNSTALLACQWDVDAMMAALPTTKGVKPLRARKILVLAHTGAGGFVHSSSRWRPLRFRRWGTRAICGRPRLPITPATSTRRI